MHPLPPTVSRGLAWAAASAFAIFASSQQPTDAAMTRAAAPAIAVVAVPTLPAAITSFGACRSGDWLWVYGGHIGKEHAHSRDNVVGAFHRLKLTEPQQWESLPPGPALQGTALVAAADGSLYRVGGLSALNEKGADADLHSTASVDRFVPESGRWEAATPLPEARSSHDALVIGDHLYVVGGWCLAGAKEGEWLRTAWVADLRQQPLVWTALPPLDHNRRAAATAELDGRLVLLGGMDADGPVATGVIYDPASRSWNPTPSLPGMAFGTAAIGIGGQVHATVADGRLLAWEGKSPAWRTEAQLETPRFFHRLVALDEQTLLAVGGAGQGGHTRSLERVALVRSTSPICQEYVIPAPGKVAQRQALLVAGNMLWAFGGNRGTGSDRFAGDQFATDIWRIDLLSHTATVAGQLPAGAQSMAALAWGERGEQMVLGGLGLAADAAGTAGTKTQTLRSVYRWDSKRAKLQPCADLPSPKTQCQLVHHGGKAWLLGGTDFVPDDTGGGTTSGDPCEVMVADLTIAAPVFEAGSIRLPRARRSFAAAVLGDSLLLVGGLGNGFSPAGPCDLYDFRSGTWTEVSLPRPWVSPKAAVIGERIYVACGGTMAGQRFTEDRSLWSWSATEGWRCVVEALPFAVRNTHVVALRNRLLFYSVEATRGDCIVIRTFEPDPAVHVLSSAMQH